MKRSITTVALSLIAGVAIAAAQQSYQPLPYPFPTPNSPGYNYGRANCGPSSGITTRRACRACCKAAFVAGNMPNSDLRGCRAFCDQVQWQNPVVAWWERTLVNIFGPF